MTVDDKLDTVCYLCACVLLRIVSMPAAHLHNDTTHWLACEPRFDATMWTLTTDPGFLHCLLLWWRTCGNGAVN